MVARAQEEVAESTMAIPTKVAGVRVEMRAVARVRLRRLQGLTSESVVLVGGGREDDAPPAKAPRRPSEAGSKGKGRYRCHEQGCHYRADQKQQLVDHCRANHGHAKLVCPALGCSKKFVYDFLLNHHRKEHRV